MTPQVLQIVASTSGAIGLLSLLAHYYFLLRLREARRSERSIREIVEGEGLFNSDQILQILREFKDDATRLNALKTLAHVSNKSAARVYDKIKGQVDISALEESRGQRARKGLLAGGLFFLSLALAALFIRPPERTESGNQATAIAEPFQVFSHERVVDLSGWREVPASAASVPTSRVVWHDHLKLRRTSAGEREFVLRRAVTGTIDPEFSSSTHRITVRRTNERPLSGPRPIDRLFDVVVDVSNEPVNEWFDLRLNSVYWNVFDRPDRQWVAIPVLFPTERIRFELRSPTKPFRAFERQAYDRSDANRRLVNTPNLVVGQGNTSIVWNVSAPRVNWVYKISWEW